MKLIRIGNSPQCDLKLDSEYVSALHAEMTILDDGQIILEDKNSRNGTMVGNKKIEPGKEVNVQRGDLITFADTQLVWARIPAAEKLSNYKAVYNIGSNYRNDIILNSQTVSRYHASIRIGKDGKVYIRDNGSRNGTMVNGVKITPNKDERIKKGDNVVCGAEDITDQIIPLIPKNNLLKYAGIAIGALLLALIIGFGVKAINKGDSSPDMDPTIYRPATVYVRACYHYVVIFKDNPMPDVWDGKIEFTATPYQATAFFLDSLGRMGTNRHVAVPWEYRDKNVENYIRQQIEDLRPTDKTAEAINEFISTPFGEKVKLYAIKTCSTEAAAISTIIKVTDRIRKSDFEISGEIDYMTVGYPGNYYTHEDEFQRCNVIKVSDNPDIDLAILQLNNKTTPKNIKKVFSPETFFEGRLEPQKDVLYTTGYPAGIGWGQDDKTKSLEPNIRETKCSKEPGKYDFEFQSNSIGGSSGSPVFNKKGQLVGVLHSGYQVAGGATMAAHAKFLKKMYDEEVNM